MPSCLFHPGIDHEHCFYGNVSILMTLILKEFYCIDVPHLMEPFCWTRIFFLISVNIPEFRYVCPIFIVPLRWTPRRGIVECRGLRLEAPCRIALWRGDAHACPTQRVCGLGRSLSPQNSTPSFFTSAKGMPLLFEFALLFIYYFY